LGAFRKADGKREVNLVRKKKRVAGDGYEADVSQADKTGNKMGPEQRGGGTCPARFGLKGRKAGGVVSLLSVEKAISPRVNGTRKLRYEGDPSKE